MPSTVTENGKELLSFALKNDDIEMSGPVYTLYEDGRLVAVSYVPQRYSMLDHDQVIEFLTLERYCVSTDTFDTQAAMALLDAIG